MQRSTAMILSNYPPRKKELLLPILQEIQLENGILTDASIEEVSQYIQLPVNKIYGVAAFYDQFRLVPCGEFHIQICKGTTCHLNGSASLQKEIEKILKVRAGSTRRDGKYSLELVACLGGCGHGPVIRINGKYHHAEGKAGLTELLRALKEKRDTDGTVRK
ncbi:MAG: NAD(P)H-dependent oxidoreductase subunit E [bacterium]